MLVIKRNAARLVLSSHSKPSAGVQKPFPNSAVIFDAVQDFSKEQNWNDLNLTQQVGLLTSTCHACKLHLVAEVQQSLPIVELRDTNIAAVTSHGLNKETQATDSDTALKSVGQGELFIKHTDFPAR